MSSIEPSADFVAAVHEALKLWSKEPAAGSPLAHLALVRREMIAGNVRRATNQALLAGLHRLALTHPDDALLLRTRFVEGRAVAAVAHERHVAEATVYKLQREALGRLAAALLAMEQEATAEREAMLNGRLPPATYDRLFGVESHLEVLRRLLLAADGPALISIEGLGGIGKTALAHRLVHELSRTDHTFADFGWVSAQQRFFLATEGIRLIEEPVLTAEGLVEALVVQLLDNAAEIGSLAPQRALYVLEARLRRAPHLIVVDNLETVTDVENLLPLLGRLAGPSRFLITSREAFAGPAGVYHFAVPELSERAALELVRHEAWLHNLPHVAAASDEELRPIYATVGGNPLALRLVAGQLQILPLDQVLENLREARGRRTEELYNFIYRSAWQRLPAAAQDVLMLMPLFAHTGADMAALRRVSDLEEDALVEALSYLARLSLINVSGDLRARRYSIHRLTETFLLKEVIKWQGQREVTT
ncbi:MAG: NB-ARC domain-containing protein [Anaerolineae bacterium]